MQAVIALCHFCENHGPRVVMTCQPMRPNDTPATSLSPSTSSAPEGPLISISQIENGNISPRESFPEYYGDCRPYVLDTEDRCKACSSFGNGPCLLSNDHPNKTSYISSEIAFHERVYDRVKTACLRSLSCEVSVPKKHGVPTTPRKRDSISSSTQPMRIPTRGSSQTSHDITAEIERVADEADGCVVFGDLDNGFCFSHTFRLQDSKARGFLRLFSLLVVSNDLTLITNNYEFLKRSLTIIKEKLQELAKTVYDREMMQRANDGRSSGDEMRPEYASVANRMPAGWFRRKIAIDTDRNLETITGEEKIWAKLHRQMMWTLRSPILTCHDQVMEGVPTQDMMVLMELDDAAIVELELHHPDQHRVSMEQLANLKLIARMLYDENIRDLELLIKQIITGGQIVVEAPEQSLSRQFLLAISNLLPIGCIKLSCFKDSYHPDYVSQFNLIGGPVGLDIPLDLSDVMVIRVTSPVIVSGDENFSLKGCRFEVKRRPERDNENERMPQLVDRYMQLLMDSEVVDTVLDTTLRTAREEWMKRAKMFYQMGLQQDLSQVENPFAILRNVNKEDREVVIFWQAGLSQAFKSHVLDTIESY